MLASSFSECGSRYLTLNLEPSQQTLTLLPGPSDVPERRYKPNYAVRAA